MMSTYAQNAQISYDGLLTASNAEGLKKPQRAYVQVSPSGVVEAVASSLARGQEHNFLILPQIQTMIIRYTRVYAASLNSLGIGPPYAICVTLAEVKGMRLLQSFLAGAFLEDMPFNLIDREQFQFDLSIFENAPSTDNEAAPPLMPILRRLANAAGLALPPYFDSDGNYTLQG
jgi:hypothetical protein